MPESEECDVMSFIYKARAAFHPKHMNDLADNNLKGSRVIEGIHMNRHTVAQRCHLGVRRLMSIILEDSWIKVMLTEDAEELYKETRQWDLQQKAEY